MNEDISLIIRNATKTIAEMDAKIAELEYKYNKILSLVKQEVANREYVCTTNHAVFCDNAKDLLKKIGED